MNIYSLKHRCNFAVQYCVLIQVGIPIAEFFPSLTQGTELRLRKSNPGMRISNEIDPKTLVALTTKAA
jgi:hypothetical protein